MNQVRVRAVRVVYNRLIGLENTFSIKDISTIDETHFIINGCVKSRFTYTVQIGVSVSCERHLFHFN